MTPYKLISRDKISFSDGCFLMFNSTSLLSYLRNIITDTGCLLCLFSLHLLHIISKLCILNTCTSTEIIWPYIAYISCVCMYKYIYIYIFIAYHLFGILVWLGKHYIDRYTIWGYHKKITNVYHNKH